MRALFLLALAACSDRADVLVADNRDAFFFDRPFPSDELLTEAGTVDLTGFPEPDGDLGQTIVGGWARMTSEAVHGFSHLSPVYVRLSEPVDVPSTLPGTEDDPVRLVSLNSGHRAALRLRFIEDAAGDPFFADNTLIFAPDPTTPLRSGETYAAVLSRDLVDPSDALPANDALADEPRVAAAWTFTVQDSVGQLDALRDGTDTALDSNPDWLQPTQWREVRAVAFAPAQTPSGRDATRCTVTYADDSTQVTWLADRTGQATYSVDLTDDAMRVFEARVQTVAWRPQSDQPYATPGIGFLSDFNRSDGRILFDANEALIAQPEPEPMRIVVQVPRDGVATAAMTWDHGTAGHAYSAVQHQSDVRRFAEVRQAAADAGVAIISRDQPLYGQRYPLIDEGFDASLGFYNIANLPAFRDNQRQGAVDHYVLQRFVRDVLPTLPDVDVQPDRVGAVGHSLGSVTAHIGLVMSQGDGADTAFMSGSGGFLANYVVQTGLLGSENDVVELLEGFVDAELPPNPNGSQAVGALMGIPEAGWERVDDLHPVFAVFQMIMDPSDPLALAPEQATPEVILLGVDDRQVPNDTTEWLADTLPDVQLDTCAAQGDYDPHICTFIEDEGIDALTDWIRALPN